MLSDHPNIKNLPSPPKRKATDPVKRWYSDAQKLEAVKMWLVTGSMPVTAASLNIPLRTIKEWRYTRWWDEIVSEIRTEGQLQLSNKLKKAAEKALDVTLDRLENGDWIMNQKTGQLERKPVAIRDAYQVTAGLLDRHMELDKRPQEEAQNQKVQDRLEALASAFEKFAGKMPKNEVIDVEYRDASNSGEIDPTIEGQGGEGAEEASLRPVEQAGDHEGERVDLLREEEELDESGGEGEGSSGKVYGQEIFRLSVQQEEELRNSEEG